MYNKNSKMENNTNNSFNTNAKQKLVRKTKKHHKNFKDNTFRLSSLSLFYPCYNEEKNVETAVLNALKLLPEISRRFEVLIINDGSLDKTKEIAEKISQQNKSVRIINHNKNGGYGAALKSGFLNSKYEWVFFTDGDLQFNIEELKNFLPYTKDYSVIIGYRTKRAEGLKRDINAKILRFAAKTLFGINVKDVDCAFKLIKKEALRKLELKSNGAIINTELLYKLKKLGYDFKELPVSHFPRKHGKPTGASLMVITQAFKEMACLYINSRFGLDKLNA